MKPLLGRDCTELLAQLAWARVLLAFDYDGTLAPIVRERKGAVMRKSTKARFREVCRLYPCAIISGRSRPDVISRLGGADVKYVIGNHGLEPGAYLDTFANEVSRARAVLEKKLPGGIELEDKTYSLALHYRRSRSKRRAREAIAAVVATLPVEMRVVPGKLVINIVPSHAPNKGDALLHLRAKENADTALYVGDDVTDEDVFELDQPGRLLTVRVGESRTSSAAYYLRDQREIDRLLQKLAALR